MLPGFIRPIVDSCLKTLHLSGLEDQLNVSGREIPVTARVATDDWIQVKDSPSGAAVEHNSLWPCHEGAHLQTCREDERNGNQAIISLVQSYYFLSL